MKKLSIVFFGSPDFSAAFLERLLTERQINRFTKVDLVVTQPDRPTGRKQIITPTPVKQVAGKYGIKVSELGNLRKEGPLKISNLKKEISNTDIALVFAYASIIPPELLTLPKSGFWCIHPSLLPKYRGTSPMATSLINGDQETGVTIIKMDEKIDHGPIIAKEEYQILPNDRRPDLEKKLTDLAFQLFVKTAGKLTDPVTDDLKPQPQNDKFASYTKKLTKQDGFIEFEKLKIEIKNSPDEIYNLYRGLYPWPGIWTLLPNGKRLKITEMKIENNKLKILSVQLEGKKEVDFTTFNHAYKLL